MAEPETLQNIYPYQPNHVLPIIFTILVGVSFLIHTYQNFHHRFWRVTFFLFYAGIVFTIGWAIRIASSYTPSSLNLYIVQTVFILAAPPIYAAAEYNILSRLLTYLPMHTPLHPRRVYIFFVYLGVAIESLTAAGGSLIASNPGDESITKLAGTLISISLLLQATIELLFMSLVTLLHHRCKTSKMLIPKIRALIMTLYGTSTLILIRCIYRTIDSFAVSTVAISSCTPGTFCYSLKTHEWPLFVFEGAPIVIYTYWLNLMHPARFLPHGRTIWLDVDGITERVGPEGGWIDERKWWATTLDPFDIGGMMKGKESHVRFWEEPGKWEVVKDGSSGMGTRNSKV